MRDRCGRGGMGGLEAVIQCIVKGLKKLRALWHLETTDRDCRRYLIIVRTNLYRYGAITQYRSAASSCTPRLPISQVLICW